MLTWIHAGDFMRHAVEHRIINFSGQLGSGKSSLAAAFSYFLEQNNYVDHTVATMPLAWAVPAEFCPPANFAVVLDELGVELDARSFADKKQNKTRRSTLAFMRKLNVYAIVASRISPDVSFRALTVQRAFSFVPLLPLEIYHYGFEDGHLAEAGWFAIWDRAWLWRQDANTPSAKYGNEYVPAGSGPALDLFERAVARAQLGSQEPNEIAEEYCKEYCRWLGMEYEPAANYLQGTTVGPASGNTSGSGASQSETGQIILGGNIPEKVSAAGFGFSL